MSHQGLKPKSYKGGRLFQVVFVMIFLFSLLGVQPVREVLAQTPTKVAAISDYGVAISDSHKAAIASMITAWDPQAVVTGGDNYHDRTPTCSSYAACVAGYNNNAAGYTDFVTSGNFFPSYGNHDAMHSAAYISYFSYLPSSPDANHLYYDVVVGDIHFWVLNGNVTLSGSAQQTWLAANAPNSTSPWNIVVVHQAPYSTGTYGDLTATQLPYQDYGIDFVLSGHNHHYERLVKNEVRYFVLGKAGNTDDTRNCDGTGSSATVEFCAGTQSPALNNFGYTQIEATPTSISFKFLDEGGIVRDTYSQTTVEPTDPAISVSPSSLAFTGTAGTNSEIKSYTVSGVRLLGNVTITPPADFEISTTGGAGFNPTNPIVLSPTAGTLSATTIYARFKRATSGTSTGNISHASQDTTTQNVTVSGTASAPGCYTNQEFVTSADTYMSGYNTTNNYGGQTYMRVTLGTSQQRGSLIRWDLSSLPATAVVSNPRLQLNVSTAGSATYNLYNMRRAWVEGTQSGAVPGSGAGATFASYDGNTANTWGTAGAANTSSDRYNTNLWGAGSTSFSTTGSKTIALNNDGLAVVQGWVDGSLPNYGLTIQNYTTGSTDVQFSTKENSTTANRPKLILDYCTEVATTYDLTVATAPASSGSVTLSPSGGTYDPDIVVTLTPVPASGYQFSSWSGADSADIINTGGVYTIVMNEDKAVTANFTLIPTNPPKDILLSNSSVMEGKPVGTVVGTLSAVDADAGETFTFSLVAGTGDTDNASFTINGDQLLTNEIFDFDTKTSYSIRVQVSDSDALTLAKAFTISILPVGVTPPLPSSFYGQIQFVVGDNEPVVGDLVQAFLDDDTTAIWSTDIEYYADYAALVYSINVPAYPDASSPNSVTFKINGRVVATADWVSGTNVELNIHPPKADAGGPYLSLVSAGSVALNGTVSDWGTDVDTNNWDFDEDGSFDDSTLIDPTFSFTSAGTYPVSLKAMDLQGGEGIGTSHVFAITLSGLTGQVYNGSPHTVTVAGVESPFTYKVLYGNPGSETPPTNTGTYYVVVQILSGTEVLGSYSTEMVIAKATATITLANLDQTYDGAAKVATATTNPAGLTVNLTYDPANPVNAGSYAVTASIDNANYQGTNSGTLVIAKATATVTLSNLNQTYDGTQKPVTVTTNPTGLAVAVTYNGSATVPSQPGSYAVVATVNETNYQGSASDTLVITGLSQAIDLVPGWNLVSFNITPTSSSIVTVLNSIAGKYSLVYAWDASVAASNWLRYDPSVGYGNTLNELDETMGFWIYMNQAATLTVIGTEPSTTPIDLSITAGGWNLIGFPALDSADLPEILSAIEGDYTLIFAYHAVETGDPWKVFDFEAPAWSNDLTQMAPGWGYWIFVTDNATLPITYE